METLKRAAIIAIAGFGALVPAQAQDYTKMFNEAKPGLDRLMQSMQYGEVVAKVAAVIPAEIQEPPRDAGDLRSVLNNYNELGSIQDFHEYLYRAVIMSGDKERAVGYIKAAAEIARMNAAYVEQGLAPTFKSWSDSVQANKKNIADALAVKEEILAEKTQLESTAKRKKADNKKLAQAEREIAFVEERIAEFESELKKAPVAVGQLNGYIAAAKKDILKFNRDLGDLESDLAAEKEVIDSKFKGDKAKYVGVALGNADGMPQRDRVIFLNRLLSLDPGNAAVKGKLDAALGNL